MELKQQIKLARQLKNIKQWQLAEMLNISTQQISMIETGRSNPSINLLKKISSVLSYKFVINEKSEVNNT